MSANRIAPDGAPRFAASHLACLELFCLPMFNKKDARLIQLSIDKVGSRVYDWPGRQHR